MSFYYKRKRVVVYCLYTFDEIEQLVYQFDDIKTICKLFNLTPIYVYSAIYTNLIKIEGTFYKIYRVVLDDE